MSEGTWFDGAEKEEALWLLSIAKRDWETAPAEWRKRWARFFDDRLAARVLELEGLAREVERQDAIHPAGYPATREGIRFGLATLQDEIDEALEAWREERRTEGWPETEGELLQVAGVAMRLLRSLQACGYGEHDMGETETLTPSHAADAKALGVDPSDPGAAGLRAWLVDRGVERDSKCGCPEFFDGESYMIVHRQECEWFDA